MLVVLAVLRSEKPRGRSGKELIQDRSRKDFIMKKKSRIQVESQIIAQLKREMQEPRLTESVRNGMSTRARPGRKEPATRLVRT